MSPFFPPMAIQGGPDQWVHTATYRPVKAASGCSTSVGTVGTVGTALWALLSVGRTGSLGPQPCVTA